MLVGLTSSKVIIVHLLLTRLIVRSHFTDTVDLWPFVQVTVRDRDGQDPCAGRIYLNHTFRLVQGPYPEVLRLDDFRHNGVNRMISL